MVSSKKSPREYWTWAVATPAVALFFIIGQLPNGTLRFTLAVVMTALWIAFIGLLWVQSRQKQKTRPSVESGAAAGQWTAAADPSHPYAGLTAGKAPGGRKTKRSKAKAGPSADFQFAPPGYYRQSDADGSPVDGSPGGGSPVLLPSGAKRQVMEEEDHRDVLSDLVNPGEANSVQMTLRSRTEVRPRSTKIIVQVEFEGKPVGRLSDIQSANLLPLIEYLESRGRVPMARATVEGTRENPQVVVWCAGPGEIDAAWID